MNSDFARNGAHGHPMPEVVLRTRRSVMEAAHQMRVQRQQRRKQMGYILLALGTLVVLAAPALWSALTDLAAGEAFTDMPVMLLTLSLVLLSAMFAVLLVSWRGRQDRANEEQR
jgi:sterol desaturase/sphingolipid hydroxylase (fatty acid hydroxylase superfamily)